VDLILIAYHWQRAKVTTVIKLLVDDSGIRTAVEESGNQTFALFNENPIQKLQELA